MKKNQTAVEWLYENLPLLPYTNKDFEFNEEILKHALEIEKQQIIDAVEWNYKSNMGEVYYKATYLKNN